MQGLIIAGVVAVGGIGIVTANSETSVVRIIDGDTLVANVGGRETTIRLLNVDTPETKDPNQAPECLGPEATDFLSGRLPVGSKIELKYDQDHTDRYGRTLAAVYQSGSLVNAEIARMGLGVAVVFEPNRKYYDEVLVAQKAAADAKVGLYNAQVGCTLPAEVDRVVQALQQVSSQPPTTSSAAAVAVDTAAAAMILGQGLETTLDAIDSESHALRSAAYATLTVIYRSRLDPAMARATQLKVERKEDLIRLQTEEKRLAEEARLAEAARLAEEARVAEVARLAEEARKAAAAAPAPVPPQKQTSTKKSTTIETDEPS